MLAPMQTPPPAPRASSQRLWVVIAVIGVVALLLMIGGGYGVAGYVSASNRLNTANHAVAGAVAHRKGFDDAPSTFVGQSGDASTLRTDADKFVKTWSDQSDTIATDDKALAAAESGLHQQQWLTVVRRGNLDSASARIAHARKALAAAQTAATEHVAEGKFLQAYADALNDFATLAADAQAADATGAQAAALKMVADADHASSLLNDPQFPPELRQVVTGLRTFAQDIVDYLNAVATGDSTAISALKTKTTADLTNLENIDTSSVPTKIDEYYQPYLDTYHSELSRAEAG